MSQINIRNLSNENDDGSPEIVGVSTFSATSFFVPPKGSTAERPSDCEPGSIRFNTDTANLEYFRGNTLGWSHFELVTPNLGGGTGSNTGLGVRALFGGGHSPGYVDTIDFVTISTLGNAQDFGDLTDIRGYGAALASKTRGCFIGGLDTTQPAPDLDIDVIDFVTIRSTGNATDFGNLTNAVSNHGAASNAVRGIVCGGTPDNQTTRLNNIQFITIATTGNAIDFGDLLNVSIAGCTVANSTRFVHHRGKTNSGNGSRVNVLEFAEIASTGNTVDFGDLVDDPSDRDGATNGHGGL